MRITRWILKIVGIKNEEALDFFSIMIFTFWLLWAIGSFLYGVDRANKPKECLVKSISDVLWSPMYALGCNLGKDRFEYNLN
jgi:hypothetical protein